MSVVTGVVLCASCGEEEASEDGPPVLFERVNAWLKEQRPYWQLAIVEDHFGGSKHPQMRVAGGGFNAFLEDEFAEFVMALPWEYPENVVLIMQPEDGLTRVFRPSLGNIEDDMIKLSDELERRAMRSTRHAAVQALATAAARVAADATDGTRKCVISEGERAWKDTLAKYGPDE